MKVSSLMKTTVILAVMVVTGVGCATVGQDYHYQNIPQLKIGKTRDTEYRQMFGEPKSVVTTTTLDGKYEVVQYVYASDFVGASAQARVLALEFRNGVLNAYIHLSDFVADKTVIHTGGLQHIKRDRSDKSDVVRYIGKPNGLAKCPSYLPDFKNQCVKGTDEVWVWEGNDKVKNNKHIRKTVSISFNKAGEIMQVLRHVGTSSSNTPESLAE